VSVAPAAPVRDEALNLLFRAYSGDADRANITNITKAVVSRWLCW
jgi:hypothetical protein